MARFYGQVFTVAFLAVAIAGGVADTSGGNLGPLALHMTWARTGFDLAVAVILGYVGFVASRRLGKSMVMIIGGVLLVLSVVGFVAGDDAQTSKGILGMHFPLAINVLDLSAGLLGVLAGLGTLDDAEVG